MMFSCLQTHVRSLVPFQRSKGGGGNAPKVSKELDLPERPQAEHRVLKRRDPLDCDFC